MKAFLHIQHPLLLARLQAILSAHSIAYETVVTETFSVSNHFPDGQPTVLLMDDELFLMSRGHEKIAAPHVKILFIAKSSDRSADSFFRLMEKGVDGIIDLDFTDQVLVNALQEIASGMGYICPRFAKSLVDYFQFNKSRTAQLSEKELMVVKLLVKGETYMRIAEMLSMSINTVRFHVKNIYRKHNIHNKTLLSRYFHDLVIDAPIAIKPAYNEV